MGEGAYELFGKNVQEDKTVFGLGEIQAQYM
jgi:hypothetical protein